MTLPSHLLHFVILVSIVAETLVQGSSLHKTNASCVGKDCGPGLECFLEETQCKRPPCPKTASCRRSCDVVRCREGFYCEAGECIDKCILTLCQAGTYCYAGECLPNPSCDTVKCKAGEECYLQVVQCFTTPCPPIPTCRPITDDKCEEALCEDGFYYDNGECKPNPTCEGVDCGLGNECYLEEVQCIRAPCPPIPTCRPLDRCALVRCRGGTTCINGTCYPQGTCDGVDCGPGKDCFLEEVQCVKAPCPPIPTCKPADRCRLVRCTSETTCINGKCYPHGTCDGVDCGPGKDCYLEEVQCVKAPCPRPVPKCQPRLTCQTLDCLPGYSCRDGKCFPPNHTPTCDNVQCKTGEECYLHQVQCIRAPCPPFPRCRPILTCATVNCISGTICVDLKCVPEPTFD